MAGYNRTRYVEQLLEKTESLPPSFTVHLHAEYWILNNGSKFLYHNQIAVSDVYRVYAAYVLTSILQSLLDDIRALASSLNHTGCAWLSHEEPSVAVEVGLYDLLSLLLSDLIDGANLGELVLSDGSCASSAIPRNRPLPDVVLQLSEIRGRIEGHCRLRSSAEAAGRQARRAGLVGSSLRG